MMDKSTDALGLNDYQFGGVIFYIIQNDRRDLNLHVRTIVMSFTYLRYVHNKNQSIFDL